MIYSLNHLIQNDDQKVSGIIQDDEALFLYSLCKILLIRNIVELGVGEGYSTLNFSKAIGETGNIIGIDKQECSKKIDKLIFINKNIENIESNDIPWNIDLIFFDAHNFHAQKRFFEKMSISKKITDDTILVVHDTNLLPSNLIDIIKLNLLNFFKDNFENLNIINKEERKLVNWLVDCGWNPLHLHPQKHKHTPSIPFRNGLTVLSKSGKL
jgi:hypothetical protein